jgi:hypothetical protein
VKIKKISESKLIRLITWENVSAICLAPFGIFVRDNKFTLELINHEMIHWQQQKELLFIFFYIWYFIEWILRKIFTMGDAYANISFEKEAYFNQSDINYICKRKKYSFIKYLKDAGN